MFLKISQIQRKIPVLKSPFDKVVVCNFIKKQWWCFPVKFMKFLRTSIYRTPMDNCFCQKKRSSVYLQDFCCKNFARPRHSCMPENFGKFQNTAGRLFLHVTAQKMKFSIKELFSKCDQTRSFLGIWSHLLKKSLMENFIFCAMSFINNYSSIFDK